MMLCLYFVIFLNLCKLSESARPQLAGSPALCILPSHRFSSCACFDVSTGTDHTAGYQSLVEVISGERLSYLQAGTTCQCMCISGAATNIVCSTGGHIINGDTKCEEKIYLRSLRVRRWNPFKAFYRGIKKVVRTVAGLVKNVVGAGVNLIKGGFCLMISLFGGCKEEQAQPTCERNPPSFTFCPKLPPVIYTPINQDTATVTWEAPRAKDDRGKPRIVQFPPNIKSGSRFKEDEYNIIFTAVDDCVNQNSDCQLSFSVKVRTCPDIRYPDHGSVYCDHRPARYGTSCRFTCHTGYRLVGVATQTCQQDETYSGGGSVTCKPVECPKLTAPANAEVDRCLSTEYNSVCTFRCKKGFSHTSSATVYVKCLSNGQWSGEPSACLDSSPPEITSCPQSYEVYTEKIQNATVLTWPAIKAVDNVDGAIKAQQIKGKPPGSYFEVGVHIFEYTATDTAGNPSPPCTFSITVKQLLCATIPFVRKMNISCPHGNVYGAVCYFECQPGYPLHGAPSATCERTQSQPPIGYWFYGDNHTASYCEEKTCDPLKPPKNGALACDTWAAGGGTHCMMSCQQNWTVPRNIDRNPIFVCSTTSGKWVPSANVPDCAVQRRAGTMRLGLDLFYFSSDCTTTSAQEEIKQNFYTRLNQSKYTQACTLYTECKAANVRVICGPVAPSVRRKRATLTHKVTIEFHFILNVEYGSSFDASTALTEMEGTFKRMAAVVKQEVMDGEFDLSVSGLDLETQRNSLTYVPEAEMECEEGRVPRYSTFTCVGCSTGSFYSSAVKGCVDCPVGQYQDQDSQRSCISCPAGTSTLTNGTRTVDGCINQCPPGSYSTSGLAPCDKCARGSYQSFPASLSCVPCREGLSTRSEGSHSPQMCVPYDLQFRNNGEFSLLIHEFMMSPSSAVVMVTGWVMLSEDINGTIFSIHSGTEELSLRYDKQIYVYHSRYIAKTRSSFPLNKFLFVLLAWNSSDCSIAVTFKDVNFRVETPQGCIFSISENIQLVLGSKYQGFAGAVTNVAVWDTMISASEIEEIKSSCSFSDGRALVTWSNITKGKMTNVYVNTPSSCNVTDHCDPNPCNGYNCTDGVHSFRCDCVNDYSGSRCEIPPNYCEKSACQNGAKCVTVERGYICECAAGYIGMHCQVQIVDGEWTEWGMFSSCTKSCGGGNKKRTRECAAPGPSRNGKDCEGSSSETVNCNTERCPECSPLEEQRTNGTVITCTEDEDMKQCTLDCPADMMFREEPLDLYECGPQTGYVWSHQRIDRSAKLPSCVNVDLPRNARAKMKFDITKSCEDRDSDAVNEILKEKIRALERNSNCTQQGDCKPHISNQCNTRGRNKRQATQTITYVISTNLDSLQFGKNGHFNNATAESSLLRYFITLIDLNRMMQTFMDAAESGGLNVTVNGVTYSPLSLTVKGSTACPDGMTLDSETFLCGYCPPGSYKNVSECAHCPIGTYQPNQGQSSCVPCAGGYTTERRGTQAASQCSVHYATSEASDKYNQTYHTTSAASYKTTTKNSNIYAYVIPVSVSISAIIICVIAVIAAVIGGRKYRVYKFCTAEKPSSSELHPADVLVMSYISDEQTTKFRP